MTIKEKSQQLAELRAEMKTLEEKSKELQQEIFDMQEWEGNIVYEDLGYRMYEKRNAKYKIKPEMEIDLTLSHPENVKTRCVTGGLSEADKAKYFDRKLSKEYLAIEWI